MESQIKKIYIILRSKTYIAVLPGETIKEQLDSKHISQTELAKKLNLSLEDMTKLINGELVINPNSASALETILGIETSFWLKLEAHYQDKLLKVKAQNESLN